MVVRNQLYALAAQLVDREVYLQLATGLEDFLAHLRNNAGTTTVPEQQRVLRLLVKDVLIGPERILIRGSIPTGGRTTNPTLKPADDEADEEPSPSSPCVGGVIAPLRCTRGVAHHQHRWPRATRSSGPRKSAAGSICHSR